MSGCTHDEEDPDGVAVAHLTAGAGLDQGQDVIVLSVERYDAVPLTSRGRVAEQPLGQHAVLRLPV